MIFFAISRSRAEEEARAARRDVDRLHPALDVRLGAVLDELLDDEAQRVALRPAACTSRARCAVVFTCLRHLRRARRTPAAMILIAGEEHDLQLAERREQVLDVVLAAVVREVLADDERELLRREAGEHASDRRPIAGGRDGTATSAPGTSLRT